MSALLKIFIGLMVIVCIMQFIEMAPEEKSEGSNPKVIDDIAEKIRSALSDENIKKIIEGATTFVQDGAKALREQVDGLKEKIEKKD